LHPGGGELVFGVVRDILLVLYADRLLECCMVRRSAMLLVAVLVFLCWADTGKAVTPEVTAGIAAVKAAPELLKAAKDLAAIPAAVGQTLFLPLGLIETVLSPLPGFKFVGGLKKVVKGAKGPFKLLGTCLKLPLSLVDVAGKAVEAVP
jgi:hypothetical protein